MRTHDVALWNGTDTSLSAPTTTQYFGVIGQIEAGGNTVTVAKSSGTASCDGSRAAVAQMVANSSYQVRPTAIYANPVLLDLIDREMKSEFNVVLNTVEITGGLRGEDAVDAGGRFAADSGVGAGIHGDAGVGTAVLPAYIVSEDLIEYHWLTDPNPRVFQLGTAGIAESAAGGGEVWGSGGEGGELRALRSEGNGLGKSQWLSSRVARFVSCKIPTLSQKTRTRVGHPRN